MSVVDDKESGSGDWRISLKVDGRDVKPAIRAEADSGEGVELASEAHSEGLEQNHKVIVTVAVSEYDGGFDSSWNLVGESTEAFGRDHDWGIGAHKVPLETDEGKVEVLYQIVRDTPRHKTPLAKPGEPVEIRIKR